ncbi:MAG: aldo/keto reductase [Spirochaetales bacterium]|nr:aldo/keto reductase [Spirochaetales bacterium]
MIRRRSKKIPLDLPRLGYGTMRMPTLEDGKTIDREKALPLIDRAMEMGINYFDTAFPYHGGDSEVFLGEALAGRYDRDSYYLATKMPGVSLGSREKMERTFAEQLRRLRADYVDFYLLHAATRERFPHLDEVHRYFRELKSAGKIRYMGFSFHDWPESLEFMVDNYEWDFVMIQHNYVEDKSGRSGEMYRMLKERGLPVFVMEPTRGGYLVNPPRDVAAVLDEARGGQSYAAQAFRWLKELDGVQVILSGMTTGEVLEENGATFRDDTPMTREEFDSIERAVALFDRKQPVPCTDCRYCLPCPFGVSIPKIFEIYNWKKVHDERDFRVLRSYFSFLKEGQRGADCRECGVCLKKCPQRIDIPGELKKIDRFFRELKEAN